jgi:hypothetical protein
MTTKIISSHSQMGRKKTYDSKVDEWLSRSMKSHEGEMTPRGRIDEACEGKNVRNYILTSMAFCEHNVSIVHVKDRNSTNMATHWAWFWAHFLNIRTTPCAKRGLKIVLGNFWRVKGLSLNIYSLIKPSGVAPWEARSVGLTYEIFDRWINNI